VPIQEPVPASRCRGKIFPELLSVPDRAPAGLACLAPWAVWGAFLLKGDGARVDDQPAIRGTDGGTIRVESMHDKGSRFRVELPVERVEESELKPSGAEMERLIGVEPGEPDYRVLIVEDVEENRLVLERLMQNTGFEVRVAESGVQGVEIFQSWRPRVIWMDLRMPGMDGKEATQRIRALEGGREVKIIAVTASAFNFEREEVVAAGMDDFIRKPYQPGEIFDCMSRQLGLRRIYDKPRQEERSGVLRKEDLKALPHELIRELADVVVTLDGERIRGVIARISDRDATVARKLTYFADRFIYTPIFEAARASEDAKEEPQEELPSASDPRRVR
jgi:CheY-like chemotaxis protein